MFKLGDVVQLKGGGPHMTITKLYHTVYECSWFVNNISINTNNFPEECLMKVEE